MWNIIRGFQFSHPEENPTNSILDNPPGKSKNWNRVRKNFSFRSMPPSKGDAIPPSVPLDIPKFLYTLVFYCEYLINIFSDSDTQG